VSKTTGEALEELRVAWNDLIREVAAAPFVVAVARRAEAIDRRLDGTWLARVLDRIP